MSTLESTSKGMPSSDGQSLGGFAAQGAFTAETNTAADATNHTASVSGASSQSTGSSESDSPKTSPTHPTPPTPQKSHPPRRNRPKIKLTFMERAEAFISRLSTRNNFFNRLCSLIWLPYAFHSGIKMKKLDETTYQAVLPFRRFNRNWYNAMAGAALLGNAEIAGGNFVFGICGGEYTVVCKNMTFKFLRPCMGPAIYRINPEEDILMLIETGTEFNTTIKMDIVQAITKPGTKERRVGRAVGIFHVTPKHHQRAKGRF